MTAPRAAAKTPVRSRGKRTRQQLLESAEQVFIGSGYLDATVADIAAQAGVAHGTFYTYFDSKEHIFREVAGGVIDEMYESIDASAEAAGTTVELINSANRAFIDAYATHAPVLGLIEQVATFDDFFRLMRVALRRKLIRRIEHAVAGMVERGEADLGRIDPYVLASALGGMVENFAFLWFVLKEPFDQQAALKTLDGIWISVLGLDGR